MSFTKKYPYTDFNEFNLDFILAEIKELHSEWSEFKILNTIKYMGEWDITKQYPAWSLVVHENAGYISVKPVPKGIDIDNIGYWKMVANYDILLADLQQKVAELELKVSDAVTPEMFGAIGDGVADDTDALKEAFSYPNVLLNNKKYLVSDAIEFSGGMIQSDNAEIIGNYNGTLFTIGTQNFEAISTIAGSMAAGTDSISIYGLAKNDDICIMDTVPFSSARPEYANGEFNTVTNYEIGTAYLEHGTFNAYTDPTVYKMNFTTLNISGDLTVTNESTGANAKACQVVCVKDSIIHIKAVCNGASALEIRQCYNCIVNSVSKDNVILADSAGMDYGLIISNSQDIQVSGSFYGRRHALTCGGYDSLCNIPNRLINIDGSFKNEKGSTLAALDLHGNCELIKMSGFTSSGIHIGGKNITVDNVIGTDPTHGVGFLTSELLPGYVNISNSVLYEAGTSLPGLQIDVAESGTVEFNISNSVFNCDATYGIFTKASTAGNTTDVIINMINSKCLGYSDFGAYNAFQSCTLYMTQSKFNRYRFNAMHVKSDIITTTSETLTWNNGQAADVVTAMNPTGFSGCQARVLHSVRVQFSTTLLICVEDRNASSKYLYGYTKDGSNATGSLTAVIGWYFDT